MRRTGKSSGVYLTACVATIAVSLALSGDSANTEASAGFRPVWAKADWPFPTDPWGKGKAFRCKAADCGGEVYLYVRAKLGYCNCTTGIADDTDLQQMGDLVLIDGRAEPLGTGRPITVGSMQGRARAYRVGGAENRSGTVISLAFNQRCDMVAATVFVRRGTPTLIEPAVLEFLNSELMLKWTETTLGL